MIAQSAVDSNIHGSAAIDSFLDRVDARKAKKARQNARLIEASKAMFLYAVDNNKARAEGTPRPRIMDYVQDTREDGPRELKATPMALARLDHVALKEGTKSQWIYLP